MAEIILQVPIDEIEKHKIGDVVEVRGVVVGLRLIPDITNTIIKA